MREQSLLMPSSSPQEPLSIKSRKFRLLTSVPPSQEDGDSSAAQPTKRRRADYRAMQLDKLDTIPRALLTLASQPLVKPTFKRPTSYNERLVIHDVAGNITPVIKARRIVTDVISGNAQVPEDWKELIGMEEFMECNLIDGEGCPHVICVDCGVPI
jgi:hypothetical protein